MRLKLRLGLKNGEKEVKNMLRRVLAWVLLAGFVLLILNIILFQYFLKASILVYLIIAIWFIFTNKPLPSRRKKNGATTEAKAEETFEEVSEEPTEKK